jgi:hypothetical protein
MLPLRITVWFLVASLVFVAGTAFTLFKPWTDPLRHWGDTVPFTWFHYLSVYDRRWQTGRESDAFLFVRCICDMLDVAVMFSAVGIALVSTRVAWMLVLIASVMTGYKTVLHLVFDFVQDYKYTRHNTGAEVLHVMVPHAVFIVLPLLCAREAWSHLMPNTQKKAKRE